VATVHRSGLSPVFTARLTAVAQEELTQVSAIMAGWSPSEVPNRRSSPFADPDSKLHTSTLYRLLHSMRNATSPLAAFVWHNRATPRVQFFAWLLVRDRIQSREHLKRRHVLHDAACEICNGAA